MRIHLGTNYQGYQIARALETRLSAAGHEVHWLGAPEYDFNDDYPAIAIRVAQAVVADEDAAIYARGIQVGGEGAGEVIAANKVNGARAVAALSVEYVANARAHADANLLVLPTDWLDDAEIDSLLGAFFDTAFADSIDDARRIINTAEFETSGTIEGWTIDEGKVTEIPADPSSTGKFTAGKGITHD